MSRKKRKSLIDGLFGGSTLEDFEELFEDFEKDRGRQSGYSISVSQTPQGTQVRAKAGKDTDVNAWRRQLQQQYRGAQIEIEGGQPLIREISTRQVEEEDQE
jgi:hypothetical protein